MIFLKKFFLVKNDLRNLAQLLKFKFVSSIFHEKLMGFFQPKNGYNCNRQTQIAKVSQKAQIISRWIFQNRNL